MPNFTKFAETSTVFHQHHSPAIYTSPSTGSLLTGTYPWKHRALQAFTSMLKPYENKNIYSLIPPEYFTYGYTQNLLAEILLKQCASWLDQHPELTETGVYDERVATWENDYKISFWGERIARGEKSPYKSALFLGTLVDLIQEVVFRQKTAPYNSQYPYEIPINQQGLSYTLPEMFRWLSDQISQLNAPYFAYTHFYPPHTPYRPAEKFAKLFSDDWKPPQKPEHTFTMGLTQDELNHLRQLYDQYIANLDHELGNFLDLLETNGMMENSYIIITSDHGEMFERGIWRHETEVIYEPVIHIPLVIHSPGQTRKKDIHSLTSTIDLLPTICHITGQPTPNDIDGVILPTFSDTPTDPNRAIFSLDATRNSRFKPLTTCTLGILQWPYKLIYYVGYEELPLHFELFNLEDDPEELNNIYTREPETASKLRGKLFKKLDQANQPYHT